MGLDWGLANHRADMRIAPSGAAIACCGADLLLLVFKWCIVEDLIKGIHWKYSP